MLSEAFAAPARCGGATSGGTGDKGGAMIGGTRALEAGSAILAGSGGGLELLEADADCGASLV